MVVSLQGSQALEGVPEPRGLLGAFVLLWDHLNLPNWNPAPRCNKEVYPEPLGKAEGLARLAQCSGGFP